MLAFLLALGLWTVWLGVGRAVLTACGVRRQSLRNWLVAPSVGLASTLLALHWLNRAGWPVDACARPLAAGLVAVAALVWWRHPVGCWRPRLQLSGLVLAAMVWAGWPMLAHGLEWFGFGNDDMANYAIGAQRAMSHGAYELPDLAALAGGRDYAQAMWSRLLVERAGVELLLAFVASVTGSSPWRVFMPTILALHGLLIACGGAMVAASGGRWRAVLAAMGLLALSPLAILGTIYQLMGQAIGLVLLFSALCCVDSLAGEHDRRPAWRRALLPALLVAALIVSYPEVLPFYAVGATSVLASVAWRGRRVPRTMVVAIAVAAALVVVALNTYLRGAFAFLWEQAGSVGASSSEASVRFWFPFYLLPAGPATFWGLVHLASTLSEPLSSALLLAGMCMLAAWAAWLAGDAPRGRVVSLTGASMLAAALLLFAAGSGFGLYKLAMFAQVPLWGSVALWWTSRPPLTLPWRTAAITALLLVASTGFRYVRGSACEPGVTSMAFCEVPYAASGRFMAGADDVVAAADGRRVVSDVTSPTIAKLLMHELRGVPLAFVAQDFVKFKDLPIPQAPHLAPAMTRVHEAWHGQFATASFAMDAGVETTFSAWREWPTPAQRAGYLLAAPGPRLSVFNRSSDTARAAAARGAFRLLPLDTPNHLAFVTSSLGQLHYAAERAHASLWQLEPDYFFRGHTMAGLGRYLLFQVLQPDRDLRLSIWISASLKSNGQNRLPPAVAVGVTRQPFRLVGRGSARVVSPPVTQVELLGREYVGLDIGEPGVPYPVRRTGVMRAYGSRVPSDPRQLTVYARDVSAIAGAAYAAWRPPAAVSQWPADLANPGLEYSGVYEDGWLSEHSYLVLDPGAAGSFRLAIDGDVPDLGNRGFTTTCQLRLDGTIVAERTLAVGPFSVDVPVTLPAGRHDVSVTFSAWQQLPRGDDRPVAARVRFAGFRPAK